MINQKILFTLSCTLLLVTQGFAQSFYTPPAGSPERKAIMDALREPAKKDLGFTVIFRVEMLRVAGSYAFARVIPIMPNGKEIDYTHTKYKEALDEGAFDAEAEALLKRDGDKWKVAEWRFGATDTEIDLWIERYNLPKTINR